LNFSDTLYAFTEWLRGTQLTEFSLWLSGTDFSLWLQTHFWAIPTAQSIHILSIAALFGSALMLDMRIFGLAGGTRNLNQLSRRYVPWIWWALLILLVTGSLLAIAEPVREFINPIFWIKMVLVAVAAILNLGFYAAVRRRAATWDTDRPGHGTIRICAILLIILWWTIMFCGRWIAYAPV
jgi:uncharacterized membrane protein